jgi:NUMOD4 motif/HNH endonuclease
MQELNPAERWAPIPGYEGHYEASDLGQIRSLDRVIPHRRNGTVRVRGRLMKQYVGPEDGRRFVRLTVENDSHLMRVHRLVLMAFVGPCPEGMEGCHNNGDPSDNRLVNLRWDTHPENMYDRGRHGTDPARNRTHCPRNHLLQAPNLVPCNASDGFRSCLACSRAQSNAKRAKERGEEFDFQAAADRHYAEIVAGTYVKRGRHCAHGHLLEPPNLCAADSAKGHRRCLACKRAGLRLARARKRGIALDLAAEADRYYAEIMAAA